MIFRESLFGSKEEVAERDRFQLLSNHEIGVLLCLLSETPIDLTGFSWEKLEKQYADAKAVLDKLHQVVSSISDSEDISKMFSEGRHFIEPIFYSASSGFWFDYLNLAPQLYELDKPFLQKSGYFIEEFAELLRQMQETFRRRFRDYIREQRSRAKRGLSVESPLSCFIYSANNFEPSLASTFSRFTDAFSIKPGHAPLLTNPIGYHPAKARPSLQIGTDNLFVPLVPMLCEQLFESPFYSIVADKKYFSGAANNRGIAAETILGRQLKQVDKLVVLENVKLRSAGEEIDQIDALGIFGSTAIIFEVKTKRLTEVSKLGDTEKLIQDVRDGILHAQQQLQNSRRLLESKLYDDATCASGDASAILNVTKAICVSVMMHEISAYPLLIGTIFEKENVSGIIPLTIFDIKIAAFYLRNAFDFLYYFSVRSVLDKFLSYGTEYALLAYHLKVRLNVPENIDMMYIDDGIGQNIDADYPSSVKNGRSRLTLKFGVEIVDNIVDQIIDRAGPEFFRLFSVFRGMSGASATKLKGLLRQIEKMLLQDEKAHDCTMLFSSIALTFILAPDKEQAAHHANIIMLKRDEEKRFDQEFIVSLRPEKSHSKHGVKKKQSSHFVLLNIAMKRRTQRDIGLTAFSPRIPTDKWEMRSE
jgi:hypothetical protein